VAPHPRLPGRVLMGATLYPPGFDWSTPSRSVGAIYLSDDAGEHFTYVPTEPISGVVQFAYDAVDPDLVYAATEGPAYGGAPMPVLRGNRRPRGELPDISGRWLPIPTFLTRSGLGNGRMKCSRDFPMSFPPPMPGRPGRRSCGRDRKTGAFDIALCTDRTVDTVHRNRRCRGVQHA